jgi:hypothetical protein
MRLTLRRGLAALSTAAALAIALPATAAIATQPPRCGTPSAYNMCFSGSLLYREGYIMTTPYGVRWVLTRLDDGALWWVAPYQPPQTSPGTTVWTP